MNFFYFKQLGITPINSFDAFNLRPGGEYKFRVTPKNRYGWGESVTMSGSTTVCDDVEIPEFTKILPGQLKALEGSTVKLECEVSFFSYFIIIKNTANSINLLLRPSTYLYLHIINK
jgi:hypothetical protein